MPQLEHVHLEREVPGVGTITFDDMPPGTPTLADGGMRKRARRCYHLVTPDDRRELPSVTTVLDKVMPKPHLMRWYETRGVEVAVALERAGTLKGIEPVECGEHVRGLGYGGDAHLKAAGSRGTAIHKVFEAYLRDGVVPQLADYPHEWHGYLRALSRFLMAYDVEPDDDGLERLVCHPELGYAGRLDLRARVNALPSLVDLKTNARGSVYLEHHLQTVAYAMADERCGAEPPASILILALGENGRYEVHEGQGTPAMWRAVMTLYHQRVALTEAIRKAAPNVVVAEPPAVAA